MISSYFTMQNSLAGINNAQLSMMQNSDGMMNPVSFGTSQPLSPAFSQNTDTLELSNKTNETKITVLQKILEAVEKKIGKDIEKSTPKFAGLDYKA